MKRKQTTKQPQFNNILDVVKRFPDEKSCREYLSESRWGKKPVCPHCGSFRKIYSMNEGKLLKCADCRKQFTVRVGTIFEDSALPLQKWFMACYILMAHKKGISSVQLAKDLSVTQKTAWFMLHRIRYAIRTKTFAKPLNGIVEADETYVGGKPRYKFSEPSGRSTAKKAVVFGMVERGGNVVAQTVPNASAKNLIGTMKKHVSRDAIVMTDEWGGYDQTKETFDSHLTVNHSKKEYVRGDVHTNTMEGFWAILKRGIFGIYHHVSKKHLDKYVDEFEYRYNNRKNTDPHRFWSMLGESEGRLTYKALIAK